MILPSFYSNDSSKKMTHFGARVVLLDYCEFALRSFQLDLVDDSLESQTSSSMMFSWNSHPEIRAPPSTYGANFCLCDLTPSEASKVRLLAALATYLF
jgi:hypothetical protein